MQVVCITCAGCDEVGTVLDEWASDASLWLLLVVHCRRLHDNDLTGTLPTELGLMSSLTTLCAHNLLAFWWPFVCTHDKCSLHGGNPALWRRAWWPLAASGA